MDNSLVKREIIDIEHELGDADEIEKRFGFAIVPNRHKVYSIIPHKSVLNSQNRRMWSVMHELLSLYSPTHTRRTINGLRVTVREKDDMWWIVRMTCKALKPEGEGAKPIEQRDIQFYVVVTETFDDVFRLRLSNHEQWKHNTLTGVDEADIIIPQKDTKVSELRLLRDNMFSLSCNYTEQTSPIRNFLDVSHQLKPGDIAELAIRLECVPRMKWKRYSEYSWQVWNKGKVPQRNVIKAENAAKSALSVATNVANEVISVAEDTIRAIEKSFFSRKSKESDLKIERLEFRDADRQQLLVNGELSKETKNKGNLPAFKATIRSYVHCSDTIRRDMIAQSIGGAFVELSADNRIIMEPCKPKAIQELNSLRHNSVDRDPVILSVDEVGKLIQLPTHELQTEYKNELQSNQAIEVGVPSVFKDKSGIYMGDVTVKDNSEPVHIQTKNKDTLFQPRVFIGSPGAGKDMAMVNFIVEAKKKHDIGTVVFDVIDERGERGMADSVRDALNPEDVIDLNLGDFDHPIYLGLQGITQSKNDRIVTNRIAQEFTSFLMEKESDGSRMADYLFACAQAAKADPILIRAILNDPNVCMDVIDNTSNEDIADTLRSYLAQSSEMKNQIAAPVLTRINKIMRDEFLKPLFGQRFNPMVDWGGWIRDGKVVIVRIPSGSLGPTAMKTIMHWLTLVVFLSKVGGCGGECFVIYNEPHQYETPGWVHFVDRMLYEGRKYRIAPIFAFYDFDKLSKDFIDVLMASGVNWHIGNNTSLDVFKVLKDVLQPTFSPEEAKEQVKKYHFIAAWRDTAGQYQTPFIYHAPDLVHRRYKTRDNRKLTAYHSRIYGRPVDDVLRDIRQRSKVTPKPEVVEPEPEEEQPVTKPAPPKHVFMKR